MKKLLLAFSFALVGSQALATTIVLVDAQGVTSTVPFSTIFANFSPELKAAARYIVQALLEANDEQLAALVGAGATAAQVSTKLQELSDVLSSVDSEGYFVEAIRQAMEDSIVANNGDLKATNASFRDKLKQLEDLMKPFFNTLAHQQVVVVQPQPTIIERVKNGVKNVFN